MAEVKPKLGVCFSCCNEDFTLSDQTGLYDATLNPYAWGENGSGDNIEPQDIMSSGLTITSPQGTVYGTYPLHALSQETGGFTVPAVDATVSIATSTTSPFYTGWMSVGLPIYIEGAGVYTIDSFTSNTAVVKNTGATGNTAPTTAISAGKNIGIEALGSLLGYSITIDPTNILGTGEGEAFSDGMWRFDWSMQGEYGSSVAFHARCVVDRLPLCAVELCVDKLAAKGHCKCDGKGDLKAQNAHLTLVATKGAWDSGQKEIAVGHLSTLQDICNNNCKNC